MAEWIQHSKVSMMLKTVDENKKLVDTLFTSGQNHDVRFLTEQGMCNQKNRIANLGKLILR